MVDKGGDKPRPIAIGNELRRITANSPMPQAIASTAEYPEPEQVANDVSSGEEAIVYKVGQLIYKHVDDDDYVATIIFSFRLI